MSPRFTKSAFLILLGLCALTSTARADLILSVDVATSAASNGRTLYTYTVQNLATSTATLASFGVQVAQAADLADVTGPVGWDVDYVVGDASIFWTSSAESYDLAPGGSLVFGFTSVLTPGAQPFAGIGFEPNGDFVFVDGMTTGPLNAGAAVPEPASVVLAASALAAALLAKARRRSIPSGAR
ncbi:hypothetical protein [Paludisphaera rhizosphaerae]|uniref:hypothetical protein n=1 Tax=Paludisphaera rhizosphaerae TaxID=2711216 RepID=UPI0013EA56FA|nr:hypothetical protein [Paludisphaera rhizosphaerae]